MSFIPDQIGLLESLPQGHVAASREKRLNLLRASRLAAENAYAPDSHFYVGASLLTKNANIYS
ncbi:MAG TPA: hypothetical protein VIF12_03120, partial [Micavibrio sp.]